MATTTEHENLYDFEGFDIDEYVRYRPVYPNELYQMIFDFHEREGTSWESAHDCATGPGIVAEQLVRRFDKVYISDSSANYLKIAEARASRVLPEEDFKKLTFKEARAEETPFLSDSSVDMVTIATALHWTQPQEFLKEAQRVLKPSGSLAVFSYGGIPFSEDEDTDKLVRKMHQTYLDERAHHILNPEGANSKKLWELQKFFDSGVDAVKLEEQDWKPNAIRIWWNSGQPMSGFTDGSPLTAGARGDEPVYRSAVKSREKPTQHITNPRFISHEVDLDWYDKYMDFLIPNAPRSQIYTDTYNKLAAKLGDRSTKFRLCWPCVLLMVSKND